MHGSVDDIGFRYEALIQVDHALMLPSFGFFGLIAMPDT
jgi:hypothetical protein